MLPMSLGKCWIKCIDKDIILIFQLNLRKINVFFSHHQTIDFDSSKNNRYENLTKSEKPLKGNGTKQNKS